MKPAVKIILGIVLVLAVAAGSFYGGSLYGKKQATASAAAFTPDGATFTPNGANGQLRQFRGGQGTTATSGSSMLFGKIKSVSEDGLVVTDNDGNELTIKVANTTLIEKNMSVKVTDLAEGETVIISGRKGDDGTITARSLQVAQQGRFMAEGGAQQMPQGGAAQGGMPGGFPPDGGAPQGGVQGGGPAAP